MIFNNNFFTEDLIRLATSRDAITDNPELCHLLENPYLKDDTELALLYNDAKYGDDDDRQKFVDYFHAYAPDLHPATVQYYVDKIKIYYYGYVRPPSEESKNIYVEIRKLLGKDVFDCWNGPCNYFLNHSTAIGQIVDTQYALNKDTIGGTGDQKTTQVGGFGIITEMVTKMPENFLKVGAQLGTNIQTSYDRLVSAVKGNKQASEGLFNVQNTDYFDIENNRVPILSDIRNRMGDCFRLYEYNYRYNPYDSNMNLNMAKKEGFEKVDYNDVTQQNDIKLQNNNGNDIVPNDSVMYASLGSLALAPMFAPTGGLGAKVSLKSKTMVFNNPKLTLYGGHVHYDAQLNSNVIFNDFDSDPHSLRGITATLNWTKGDKQAICPYNTQDWLSMKEKGVEIIDCIAMDNSMIKKFLSDLKKPKPYLPYHKFKVWVYFDINGRKRAFPVLDTGVSSGNTDVNNFTIDGTYGVHKALGMQLTLPNYAKIKNSTFEAGRSVQTNSSTAFNNVKRTVVMVYSEVGTEADVLAQMRGGNTLTDDIIDGFMGTIDDIKKLIMHKPDVRFEGVKKETVYEMQWVKEKLGGLFVTSVTDGTHASGQYSHANGYKFDFRDGGRNDSNGIALRFDDTHTYAVGAVTNINGEFLVFQGKRITSKGTFYKFKFDGRPHATYTYEDIGSAAHWDVQVIPS